MSTGMRWFLMIWAELVILVLASCLAHCSTTNNRKNSLGVYQGYDSPFTYFFGNPTAVNVFTQGDQYYTNVSLAPYGASLLNTEQLMLCGDQELVFSDTTLRIITYRRASSRMYQGIACHEVIKVIEVQLPKERLQ